MREHFHNKGPDRIWIAVFLSAISFALGCSKSDKTTSGDVKPASLLAATSPEPSPAPTATATANRPTAAERIIEIERLLASPLTGTPEQSEERALLRAERAALISSGQVPYQSGNQAPGQLLQSGQATIAHHSPDGDTIEHGPATADARSGQIVIAQASSLPFLEQMTPTERDHYFQELFLQNSSLIDVNVNRWGVGLGRPGLNRGRANMRPPGRAGIANQPLPHRR
jgi:hypothetical protein